MMPKTRRVYIVKVKLMGPGSIWRKISISENHTLSDLHDIIFDAFDRCEDHLYSFFFPSKKTKSRRTIYSSPEYAHPMALDLGGPKGNATRTTLKTLRLKPKTAFYYLFDYGDSWWHEITVEAMETADSPSSPAIIASRGESPPQYYDPEEDDE